MKVTLLCDWAVRGTVYSSGETVDLAHDTARVLLAKGVAVEPDEDSAPKAAKAAAKAKKPKV